MRGQLGLFRFNPRVLAGGRDGIRRKRKVTRCVSIHASSREDATDLPGFGFLNAPVSIHASSREDATIWRSRHQVYTCFNPRVLAGGRDFAGFSVFHPP